MDNRVYTVKEIRNKKGGELDDLHSDILGCECTVFRYGALGCEHAIMQFPQTNSGRAKNIMTSYIVKQIDTDGTMTIETNNSVYILS